MVTNNSPEPDAQTFMAALETVTARLRPVLTPTPEMHEAARRLAEATADEAGVSIDRVYVVGSPFGLTAHVMDDGLNEDWDEED
jgi:hypothetical protein